VKYLPSGISFSVLSVSVINDGSTPSCLRQRGHLPTCFSPTEAALSQGDSAFSGCCPRCLRCLALIVLEKIDKLVRQAQDVLEQYIGNHGGSVGTSLLIGGYPP